MKKRLFVSNVHYDTTEPDIRALFAGICEIAHLKMCLDKDTKRFRGFCFVIVNSETDMKKAIDELHNMELNKRKVRVVEAVDKPVDKDGNKRKVGDA